jgi:hypothetical protein
VCFPIGLGVLGHAISVFFGDHRARKLSEQELDRRPGGSDMTERTTARVVGGLFIAATVAGLVGIAFSQPVVDAPDYLTRASLDEGRLVTGALFELLMGVAVVGIAIAIYPVLRRHSARLALGYVAARTIEAAIYVIGVIALLTLLTVSREFVDAGAPDASYYKTLGGLLLAERDWGGHAVLDATAFSLSALILNYVLYRARLVPSWLSTWGLVGASLYLAAGVMVFYGLEPLSTTQVVLEAPLGVQEMALAVWLIVKGFDARASVSEPMREPVTVGG